MGVLAGKFDERGALESLAGPADEDDAVCALVGQGGGELDKAFDGPAFGGPSACGGENNVGVGIFNDDLGELILPGVQLHVGVGDITPNAGDKGEHSVNGVHGAGGFDAVGVENPPEFLGVAIAIAFFGTGDECEEGRPEEALGVDHDVIFGFAKRAKPADQWTDFPFADLLGECFTRELDDGVELGLIFEGTCEGILHEPVNPRIGVLGAECCEDRDGSADIAQSAGADNQDFDWLVGGHGVRAG